MPRLSLVIGTVLLLAARVLGTALPLPSSCLEDARSPHYLLPSGGGVDTLLTLNPAQKNEKFVLEEVWTRHLKWNKLAKQTKSTVYWGRVTALVFLFAGGFLQTSANGALMKKASDALRKKTKDALQNKASDALQEKANDAVYKVAGSTAVATAAFLKKHLASKDNVQEWTHAMAISEKIKGQVYRFRAGVPPYELKDFEAVKRLVSEVTKISEANKNLTLKYARTELNTKEKISVPPKLNRDLYLEKRYQTQVDQYLRDAKLISRKVGWLKKLEGVLLTASTLIGPLSCVTGLGKTYDGFVDLLGVWPSAMTSGGMAIASHYHACKYEEEAEEWSHAAARLTNLRLTLPNDAEPDVRGSQENEWRAFVERCEQIILDSTIDWTALKNRPDEPHPNDKAKKQ